MTTPGHRSLQPVGSGALHGLLRLRRSIKHFTDQAVSLEDLASLLAAMVGETGAGHRAIPSARASYPLSVTVVAGLVNGLDAGIYRHDGTRIALQPFASGDHRPAVADATLDAAWLASCPALLLVSADLEAARTRFIDQPPAHGERFVWLEAGCMAQNAYLWAAEHRLGTVLIAGLDDARARDVMVGLLPSGHDLIGILPIGHAGSED